MVAIPRAVLPAHLHVMLEVLDGPALLVGADGLVMGASTAMARQLGTTPAALIGQPLAGLITSARDQAATFLRRVSAARQTTMGALAFRRADGSEFVARCHGNLVDPGDHRTPAILCLRCQSRSEALSPFIELNRRVDRLTGEIARRQEAEARLQRLNQDLEERVWHEVAARVQAQGRLAQAQRLEALGQLAAGIAHDFNNVLQAVSGGLALIDKRAGNPETVRQIANMTLDAAERGAAITGRLLAFARQGELRAEAVTPEQLLMPLKEMLTPTLGSGIAVELTIAPATPTLQVDKGQIETLLVNLAVNARDAMPEGGRLAIAAAPEQVVDGEPHAAELRPGRYVRIAVTDSGIGMDAATLARAAEPFFTTKPVGKGTGLGLAMARGFVRQSGGGLAIQSALGYGTTVTLWIPTATEAGSPGRPAPGAVVAGAQAGNARIMVVDDDAIVREVLVGHLEDCGYRIVQASDGLAASAWLEQDEPIDLLITDFAMPGMNGLSLIRELRQRRPSVPAMLLTGYADAAIQLGLTDIEGGRTVLLRKPVRSDDLAEQAAALLAASRVN